MSEAIEFFSYPKRQIPVLLRKYLSKEHKRKRLLKYLDMGCGEAQLTLSLINEGLVNPENLTCLDISRRLLNIAKKNLGEKSRYVETDVRKTGLESKDFDFIYSWMVIEHVRDPENQLKEIRRLLKDNGVAFFATIVKRPWAIYFYRAEGKFVVDPTHLHEFSSVEEAKELCKSVNLRVIETYTKTRKYSLIELVFKVLLRSGLIKEKTLRSIIKSIFFERLRKFEIPTIGFYELQVVVSK